MRDFAKSLLLVSACGLLAGISACNKSSPTSPTPTPAATCTFTVGDGPAAAIAASGAEFVVSITTNSGCAWTASSNAAFISSVGTASGSGSGSVRFAVQSNTGAARLGSVLVAGRTLSINQAEGTPQTCDLAISPTDVSIVKLGGDVQIDVTMTRGDNCAWTTTSNDAFISVKSGGSGAGSGQAVLSVAANAGGPRTGTATVAGHTVTVQQDPAIISACTFNVSPTVLSAVATGGPMTVAITVTGGSGCAWVAQSQAAFLTFQGATSGVGPGTLTIIAALNAGTARSGTVLVAGQTVSVNQAATSTGGATAVLAFQSDPGDDIGAGQTQLYALNASRYELTLDATHSQFHFAITPGTGDYWTLNLTAPSGQALAPGLYNNAVRLPALTPGQPGMDFYGNGRGCNQTTGRFLVAEAVYGPSNSIARFHAKFEQHCDGWSRALHGEIWIDSSGAAVPPMADLPSGPASPTTFFSYQSDPGDSIGRGASQTFTLAEAKFVAWPSDFSPAVNVRVLPPNGLAFFWNLDFDAPSGTRLLPGTYAAATRFPLNPNGVPGLSITGNGGGCNTVTGSFVVLEATYGPQGEVLRFHATFEQHCDGAVPALRGEIYIVANPWK